MERTHSQFNTEDASHILGYIYGMLQYAHMHNNTIEKISDEAMLHVLQKLNTIIEYFANQ